MRVRRLDQHHDWTFGQSFSNYAVKSEAIAQNVKTRLLSFERDWFLNLDHGLPWLAQMGKSVDLNRFEMLIKKQVLETDGVVKITSYQANVDEQRKLTVEIGYEDVYGVTQTAIYGGDNGSINA